MGDDILPTVDYPPMIRGSLRLMLQLKDAFLGSFNLVEEYRDQLLACKHGFTRDLVVYQLTKGLAAISRLREDLAYIEAQGRGKMKRNVALRQYILSKYSVPASPEKPGSPLGVVTRMGQDPEADPNRPGTGTAIIGNTLPPPINAPDSVEQALHGGLDHFKGTIDVDVLQVPEEIDLATTTTENGTHLLPVVDFYRGFFFLQMHFQLIMCQAANYAMPVVTRPMSVAERAFSWPSMPNFGMAATAGSMKDRLLEIHTDVMALAMRLHDCLGLVREKMKQDRKIESYFMQHTAAQENLRRNLLRGLQAQRVYIESLESQNDRLAGLAIKLDPNFAKSADFALMTGPGVTFQDADSPTVPDNQNSAIVSPNTKTRNLSSIRKGSENNQRDKGSRRDPPTNRDSGKGSQPSRSEEPKESKDNQKQMSDKDSTKTGSQQQSDNYSYRTDSQGLNSQSDNPAIDMNVSGTGGGRPAIWVQHGTLTSTEPMSQVKRAERKPVEVDVELTQKINTLRGQTHAVDELLIGVDSVATGTRKLGLDVEHLPTPSFLNTEHYVTSIYDDIYGQTPRNPVIGSRDQQALDSPSSKQPSLGGRPNLHTPSTKYSQAEPLSPTISFDQPGITVFSPTTDRSADDLSGSYVVKETSNRLKHDAVNLKHHEDKKRFKDIDGSVTSTKREGDSSDDSILSRSPKDLIRRAHRSTQRGQSSQEESASPRPVDTNVNASNMVLPSIIHKTRKPIPRLSRTSRSSSTSFGPTIGSRKIEEQCGHAPKDSGSKSTERPSHETRERLDRFDQGSLKHANDMQLQVVTTVSAAECGHLCVPEWVAKRSALRVQKAEDLLEEPKRTAFSKAVLAHRHRLVETILQADEDRLEEIISLLLKE